ncbi:ABC transporter ATP-binding protein [Chelatococcus asaccharovorans]|uniref:Amino acid/amide ABC transporter ATP-binding protein 1 (HAAT family) n=1 Tax=Chelatococcus asaccharovorans TaxID=28210 RepID=A0A2V3U100_9HYPH|nr:ABC transporter ATP-binding protein [Chelatococcus asaccharovorans]MBS7707758.1 ABC transporter ATP-binding protein [Chelatococcus asaccharovorans]PXW55335.1 amino acid/amide ABC transporter ATP-binding protein 1 (HAAT family) [Chelatococcus asaccharovorans]
MTAILETRALRKSFGGLVVTRDVDLTLEEGETHALIGPNGAGKTSLVNLLSGTLSPTAGDVLLAGEIITRLPSHRRARRGLARTFQISTLFDSFTAEKSLVLALLARQGHCYRLGRMAGFSCLRDEARRLLDLVGLTGRNLVPTASMSHGEHRQLELALALAASPKVMLLDEPMAGLGGEETAKMIELLRSLRGRYTILLVEHDMDAVFALADRISVLAEGRLIATGSPADIRSNAGVRQAYFGDDDGD